MKRLSFVLTCLLWMNIGQCDSKTQVSSRAALQRLMDGNQRYLHDKLEHPDRTTDRREATKLVQSPYAVIVCCSDSRVPPEIIFDTGIGDLFVVRVAGNAIGPLELESVQYAVSTFKSSLIFVMGHESCGAVKEVLAGNTQSIQALTALIEPAVQEAKKNKSSLTDAVKDNARYMLGLLLQSNMLKKLSDTKQLEIRAAYYDLKTGAVELL